MYLGSLKFEVPIEIEINILCVCEILRALGNGGFDSFTLF